MGWLSKQDLEPPIRTLIVRVVRLMVLALALVLVLDKFGVQITPLIAGIGVAGVGIGLALQGVLGNLMAGLTIIFTKPFRVGEYIELLGVYGQVTNIELFSTTLMHADQLARRHSQPQDRRRNHAQLRHDPPARPQRRRCLRREPDQGGFDGARDPRRAIRACSKIRRRSSASTRWAIRRSTLPSNRGSKCPTTPPRSWNCIRPSSNSSARARSRYRSRNAKCGCWTAPWEVGMARPRDSVSGSGVSPRRHG